jgi:hypothetical protein
MHIPSLNHACNDIIITHMHFTLARVSNRVRTSFTPLLKGYLFRSLPSPPILSMHTVLVSQSYLNVV